MSVPIFRTESLCQRYDAQSVLDGISLSVASGSRVGIVGPNGAGKTTLLRILAGVLKDWNGTVEFCGKPIAQWNRRAFARRVAYLPQQAGITFAYSVYEVVLMGRLPYQEGRFFESREDRAVVSQALKMAECSHLAGRKFQELSGGEQQLVCLASALAQQPQVLLLDEPTVFLDLKHQLQIGGILTQLHQDQGVTMLLVTHDLNLAGSFCDRILFLKEGRISGDLSGEGGSIDIPTDLLEEVFDVSARDLSQGPGRRIVLSYGKMADFQENPASGHRSGSVDIRTAGDD